VDDNHPRFDITSNITIEHIVKIASNSQSLHSLGLAHSAITKPMVVNIGNGSLRFNLLDTNVFHKNIFKDMIYLLELFGSLVTILQYGLTTVLNII